MQKILFSLILLAISAQVAFAQFTELPNAGNAISTNSGNTQVYREGDVGIGFLNRIDFLAARGGAAGLTVSDKQIAQVRSGNFGQLDNNSIWSALGLAGPATAPNSPYGLAMTRANSVGFFNLTFGGPTNNGIPNTVGQDLIAGFGSGDGNAQNRFILRSYNNAGTQAFNFKNLLVANPGGATGINAEPLSTFWVDARLDNATPFRNIAIVDLQNFGFPSSPDKLNASSGIGAQANGSLQNSGILAEGFRAQYPAFGVAPLPAPPPFNTLGVATNVQVVKSPFGGPNANAIIDVVSASNVNGTREYAEITWQDLDIADPLSATDCSATIPVIEGYDKMFISFRNN